MTCRIRNINQAEYQQRDDWRFLDLSGERLGVRIEELSPGASSSVHHYHTLEEEHVVALEGSATLILGEDEHNLASGDHVCFPGGEEIAHHIENRTDAPFRFLVFDERITGDVVFYPDNKLMLVKAPAGTTRYTYEPRQRKLTD